MLAIGNVLMAEGHELLVLTGNFLQERIERAGARFHALPGLANIDLGAITTLALELLDLAPGYDWLRIAMQRCFIDLVPDQHRGLEQALQDFPADVIIADDMFFGALPMLLKRRSERSPIVLCGTPFLHWCREDGAPHFLGLPLATSATDLERYAAIAEEYEQRVNGPSVSQLNEICASSDLPA